jgi:excisionase family DNA binding protein
MATERLLYKVDEAAEALGLSRVTLYSLMARGEVDSIKVGAARRIPADELRRFVERNRQATGDRTGPVAPTDRDAAF